MFRRAMGVVRAKVTVYSTDQEHQETLEVLVDTGSTLTWIPEDAVLRLSIEATGRALFETADGRTVERSIGDALVDCTGSRGIVGVAFARPGDSAVLGVTALERLGLEVDPVRRVLRKVDRYLALGLGTQTPRGSVI